jgi:uncharacterized glyoxalase superfamily protein PhnB
MPAVTPVLRYRDAHRAVEFLERGFGLRREMVHEDEGGAIVHAELSHGGDGIVMIGPEGDEPYGSHAGQSWIYLAVEDADAHFEQAKAAGAEILREPVDQDYGSRDYSARDVEGNIWSFGTYHPQVGQ